MLLTIGEIIQRFRTHGACYKFSPKTITYMAKKLGFGLKRVGGKVGYDQSLITAITQRFNEAVEYDKGLGAKEPQKVLKQPKMGDYYTYNGERDNKDYEWEKNENKDMKTIVRLTESDLHDIVKESVKNILENIYSDEEAEISIKNMFEYNDGYFYWTMMNYDVQIGKTEVTVGYFDEEKHGMPYSEYEDPDGWELDSFILPINQAWELFLKECFEEYVSCVESNCDIRDSEIGNIVANFKVDVEYMRPNDKEEYGIVYKEGSPFGYTDD